MAGWVDLHVHSNYSFLDGASHVDDLVDAAVEQGMDALALTDTNGLYGAVRFANAAKERGVRPIFGTELQLLDAGHLVLIARDRQGWTSLTRTISAAQLAGEKTKPKGTFSLLAENAAGLYALTGCAHGAVPKAARAGDLAGARETLARLASVFGDRLFVELSDHLDPDDPAVCDELAALAGGMGLGCVVTNNVHYARPEGRRLHDVLRCIDLGTTLDEAGNRLKPNGEYWLKGEAMLRERLGRFDEAFRNAREIADACVLDLLYDTNTPRVEASFVGKDRLPGFPVPEGHTAFSFLYALCGEAAKVRYPRITRDVAKQLAHELDVIDRCGLAEFFLINWDIVRFCKEHRIPAQGRGSAADSIVAYVLDITKVDPIQHDLLFERFLTEDSRTMPDIDLDIATNDREEVIQYVYKKYGERYAAMVCNVVMLITALPLVDTVPIERATMPDRNVVQFDKRDVEDLGLVKMDLLGLRTLSLVKDAVADIEARHGELLELGSLPLDDPAVYDLICEVDTIGLFQVESRAQAQALPRVRPRNFADIVVEVAIIRPGPLQGNMVNPYIRRRQGREPVQYAHPLLEPILKETLGVILFQEQILRVAIAAAGFSPSAADLLRRAMSRARSSADMEKLRGPFVTGAAAKGVDDVTANEIFRQIAAFAEFGFCKSHAAAFALTAYHTAHLKLYYPAEFYVGLLNNQPMGFYSPAVIAGDAKRHGVAILPVDVNRSSAKAVVEASSEAAPKPSLRDGGPPGLRPVPHRAGALGAASSVGHPVDSSRTIASHRKCRDHDVRIGFGSVKGLGEEEAKAVVEERQRGGQFKSFDEFATRVGLKEEALRNLALVGAFDSFGEPRRALLWRARDAHRTSPSYVRRALSLPTTEAPSLPPVSDQERTALDYRITGIPTGPQIMSFYREDLARRGVLRACDLESRRHGSYVLIAGAVVVKQHPETAKGHVFLSLEDETGISNIIIRPATYRKFKRVLDSDAAVVVGGTLQTVDGVISVTAERLDALQLFAKSAEREWQ